MSELELAKKEIESLRDIIEKREYRISRLEGHLSLLKGKARKALEAWMRDNKIGFTELMKEIIKADTEFYVR